MRVKHFGWMGMTLSALVVATAACSGGEMGADSLGDSGAVNSASGDVAANMTSPAAVRGFLMTVNTGEIEAGQLAQTKGTHAQVRQYAEMMVTDHRRANAMLDSAGATGAAGMDAAGASSTAAGGQPAANIEAMHQQAMTTLQNTAKGRGFDSTYMAIMVMQHQDVLSRLEQMRGTGGTASGATAPSGTAATGTGNPGAVGSTGTTQSAGAANEGDPLQTHLQNSIAMVRQHLERGQEVQRALQGSNR